MRARTWGIVILVNVAISAAVVVGVLMLWDRPTGSSATAPDATLPAMAQMTEAPTTGIPVAPAADAASVSETSTPPGEYAYVVRAGDTLTAIAREHNVTVEELMAANGLADPNVLSVGQVLIVPAGQAPSPGAEQSSATPEPAEYLPTPLPTPTSAGPPLVEIEEVHGTGNLAIEVIVVYNRGGTANLDKWVLSDPEGNVFIFPPLTLFPDAQVRIHTAQGINRPTDLYWGRLSPAWAAGELITLRDAVGTVVDSYIVP